MKVGRNQPCPCGSGMKVKRCCGVARVRRVEETAEELFGLALNFPFCRPASAAFDAWAEGAPDRLSQALLDEGAAALGEERERIPAVFDQRYPAVWASLLRDFGNDDLAREIVVAGAVLAGLEERQRPAHAELVVDGDPVETLALALRATDLWSVLEAVAAVERIDGGEPLAAVADALWSDWHEERLALLVRRLDDQPPFAPACSAFAGDERVRRSLRAELLLDALPNALDAFRLAA